MIYFYLAGVIFNIWQVLGIEDLQKRAEAHRVIVFLVIISSWISVLLATILFSVDKFSEFCKECDEQDDGKTK